MKKFSLFAILLGFNIALGACSDDDAAPGVGILILPVFLLHSRVGLSIRVK